MKRAIQVISFAAAIFIQAVLAAGLPTDGLQVHFRADHAEMIKTSAGLPLHGSSVTNWITETGVATPLSLVRQDSNDYPRWQTNAFVRADGTPRPALRFRRNTDNTADVGTTNRLVSTVRTSLNIGTASTWLLVMNNLVENTQCSVFGFLGGENVYETNRFGAFFTREGHLRLNNNSNPLAYGNIALSGGSSNLIDSRGEGSRMTSGLNGSEVINIKQDFYARPSDQALYLGRFYGIDDSAAFDCAELAIYNRALNDAEITIARNSLAARWGLALEDPIWTGATAGFCDDLAGIGSSTATGTGRIPGAVETSASAGGLFVSVAEGSLSGVDGYLLVAHDGKAAKQLATDGNTRLARTWRAESTFASPPAVTFSFDLAELGFTAGEFSGRLFRRANASSAFADTGISGVLADGKYSFTFAAGTPSDGEYALVVDDATIRPCAGVSGSLQGWYRADTGVAETSSAVSKWRNLGLTGCTNDLSDVLGSGSPTLSSTAFPRASGASEASVHFDGSSWLKTAYETDWGVTRDNAWFAVFKVPSADQVNVGVFGSEDSVVRFGAFFTGSSDLRCHAYVENITWQILSVPHSDIPANAAMLLESCRSNPKIEICLDGMHKDATYDGTNIYVNARASKFMIGQMANLANKLTGDVAEIRIYNSTLSDVERNIVANHLAARYGVAMQGRSLYDGAADDCVLDVVGVGCTTTTGFGPDGVMHVAGTVATSEDSAGLTLSAGPLEDGDYVLAGHGEKENSWVRLGGGLRRMRRAWHITKTNASLTDVALRFDISASGIAPVDPGERPAYVLMRSVGDGAWEVVDASVAKEREDVYSAELPAAQYVEGLYTLGAECFNGLIMLFR